MKKQLVTLFWKQKMIIIQLSTSTFQYLKIGKDVLILGQGTVNKLKLHLLAFSPCKKI
jgi:hypothetical protein